MIETSYLLLVNTSRTKLLHLIIKKTLLIPHGRIYSCLQNVDLFRSVAPICLTCIVDNSATLAIVLYGSEIESRVYSFVRLITGYGMAFQNIFGLLISTFQSSLQEKLPLECPQTAQSKNKNGHLSLRWEASLVFPPNILEGFVRKLKFKDKMHFKSTASLSIISSALNIKPLQIFCCL